MSDIRVKVGHSGAHTHGPPTERPALVSDVQAGPSHSPRPDEPLNRGSSQQVKRRSLACLLLLGSVSATATVASPGFDCEKARSSPERVLCQDQLRTYYADARRADALGISTGPLVLACRGFDALIGLTFIGNRRDIAFIEWRNLAHAYVLERERGGPGVTYTGSSAEGAAVFWTSGERAQLQLADQITMECKIKEPD